MLTTTFKVANADVASRKKLSKQEFHARMAEAAQSGRYDLPRHEGSDHVTPIPGVMATNMTRVQSCETRDGSFRNACDPEYLTNAEIEGRRQALEYLRFLKEKIPGYAHAELVSFGMQIGVRESRRVQGDYRRTREDVLTARQFDDQIGLCGAPIEEHHAGSDTKWVYLPDGSCVGIPYRALFHRGSTMCSSQAAASPLPMMPMPASGRWRSAWRWDRRREPQQHYVLRKGVHRVICPRTNCGRGFETMEPS